MGASAKTIVACDEFLVVRSTGRCRSRVCVVGYHLVAQRGEGQGVICCADPGSRAAAARIARHALDHRRGIRVRAIRRVVAFSERRDRNHRRVQVSGITRHKWHFITEGAICRGVIRIRDHGATRTRDRPCIVHARNHHVGRVTGYVGYVDFPAAIYQSVVNAPLVRI